MSTLQQTQTVMHLADDEAREQLRVHLSDPLPPLFVCPDDDGNQRAHELALDPGVWADMREVDVITVTIVPGDTLN